MPTSTRVLLALCLVAFAAACAPKPQEVVVEEVTVEPTFTGKYN
jgi:hypothetical protein